MEELLKNSSDLLNLFIESSPAPVLNRTIAIAKSSNEWKFMLLPYLIIFCMSLSGNCMVIATLANNRRMRTVTNVYLLNLAVSDFLLGALCMPFTLVGQIYRRFLFGATMCKLIPFLQAVSVSVSVWTLVAISLERYFAICRPLKSRKWQTKCHAYKMIATVWIMSFVLNSPILVVSTLQLMRENAFKCREFWQSLEMERAFNLILDMALLLVPLFIMVFAYSLIVCKLWRGMRHEMQHRTTWQNNLKQINVKANLILAKAVVKSSSGQFPKSEEDTLKELQEPESKSDLNKTETFCMHDLESDFRNVVRSTHIEKSIVAKRKVIRMLFVIIAEFFVCWTPLHVINTDHIHSIVNNASRALGFVLRMSSEFSNIKIPKILFCAYIRSHLEYSSQIYLFFPEELYKYIGSKGVMSLQLLAYCSSCCNPITYCFMNRNFQQAFLALLTNCRIQFCFKKDNVRATLPTPPPPSSSQEVAACVIRGSQTGRSDLEGPDVEDCV